MRRDWGVSSSIQEEVAMVAMLLRRMGLRCFIVACCARDSLVTVTFLKVCFFFVVVFCI